MSWLIHRVDDRLIHGQVVIAWGARLHPQRIWVVDDASAASPWERDLLSSAAPDAEVHVVTIAEAAVAYPGEAAAPGGAFLLMRGLETALALVEAGAQIPSVTLGGLHYAPGKNKVNEYVYLDADDRRKAAALLKMGVTIEVQDVPATRAHSLASLDPETTRS
jgi:mannose/fructose/N-acetylgalactosamine-specific phosphotransferase system component IIB